MKIILNTFDTDLPNLDGFTIKKLLYENTTIIDWGIHFAPIQKTFVWGEIFLLQNKGELSSLFLLNYLAAVLGIDSAYYYVKGKMISEKPDYVTSGFDFFDKHIHLHAQKMNDTIDTIIQTYRNHLFLFNYKDIGFIYSFIVGRRFTSQDKKNKIAVFGFENKKQAHIFLTNNDWVDYGLWGSNQEIATSLSNIANKIAKEEIPNLVYRKRKKLYSFAMPNNTNKQTQIVNYNSYSKLDYSSFFESRKEFGLDQKNAIVTIPAPTAHDITIWTEQDIDKYVSFVKSEIIFYSSTYQVCQYSFSHALPSSNHYFWKRIIKVVTELNGNENICFEDLVINVNNFDKKVFNLLDQLPLQHLRLNINTLSDQVQDDYAKQNTFAETLLFLKFANKLNMPFELRIKKNIEENNKSRYKQIENLHFLRFSSNDTLSIQTMDYDHVSDIKDFSTFAKVFLFESQFLWDDFEKSLTYYTNNYYHYQLEYTVHNSCIYTEYLNDVLISQFEFSDIDLYILQQLNEKILTINSLVVLVQERFSNSLLDFEVINIIEDLYTEKLIYISANYQEIVSLINLNRF